MKRPFKKLFCFDFSEFKKCDVTLESDLPILTAQNISPKH